MIATVIDPTGAPAYRQIAVIFRGCIADGTWPPGSSLPSEPDLAVEFGIGRDTIVKAIAVLHAEGAGDGPPRVPHPGTRSRRVGARRGAGRHARHGQDANPAGALADGHR